jgi:hypothetical protein
MFCAISAKRVGYAELFADAYRRRILDFAVSWNRTRALSGGIEIDAVAAAFPYQKATVSFYVPNWVGSLQPD